MARLLITVLLLLTAACADPAGVGVAPSSEASPALPTAGAPAPGPSEPTAGAADLVADCPPPDPPDPSAPPIEEATEYWANPPEEVAEAVADLQVDPVYAGARIERTPDGPYFRIFVTGDADRIRQVLAPAADATGYRIEIEEVARSHADLQAVQDRLFTDPIDLGPSAQLLGAGIDDEHNVVAVDVVAVDDQARAALAQAYGADWLCIRPQEGPPADVQPGGGADDVVEVPTSDIANMQQALMEGVLRADGTDCLWVEGAGTATDIVWPPGYGARETPDGVELVDDTGTVVAREGDQVSLGGGFAEGTGAGCAPGGSAEGAFVAGSVSSP